MRRVGPKDALFTLAAFLYSLPAWAYPFGNDQALHWYIGKRWLEGELPFVSAISSKPIGIFVVHALSTALFGSGMWAIRVTESITVLFTGYLIALATRELKAPRKDGELGLGALVFSGVYYTFFDYWDTAHPELWEATCALAAWVVALRAERPWQRDAGAGALATAAFMFKYPAGLPALGISALCAVRAIRERAPGENWALAVLRAAGRFLCGVVPVVLLCVLPFAIGGELETMWEILGVYIFHYADQAPPLRALPAWMRLPHGGALLLVTLALSLGAGAVAVWRRDREALWRFGWLTLAALLAAGSVSMQKRYFTYHFVAAAPALATLIVLGLRQLAVRSAGPSWGLLAGVSLSIALAFWAGPRWTTNRDHSYARFTRDLLGHLRGDVSREALIRPFRGIMPLDATWLVEGAAAQVNALKRPGDTLCTRGFLTPMYPLTGLRCTSRHIVEDNVPTGLPDWRREYRTTLEAHPPTFMVTFGDRPRDLSYLYGRGYRLVGKVGLLRILSLREATGEASGQTASP
jgi:hypothetical protein